MSYNQQEAWLTLSPISPLPIRPGNSGCWPPQSEAGLERGSAHAAEVKALSATVDVGAGEIGLRIRVVSHFEPKKDWFLTHGREGWWGAGGGDGG